MRPRRSRSTSSSAMCCRPSTDAAGKEPTDEPAALPALYRRRLRRCPGNVRQRRPVHRTALGDDASRRCGGSGPGRARRASRLCRSGLGRLDRQRARQAPLSSRRPRRRRGRAAGRAGNPRYRQDHRETRAQIGYVAEYYRYFADLADKLEGAHLAADKADMGLPASQPIGVVAPSCRESQLSSPP